MATTRKDLAQVAASIDEFRVPLDSLTPHPENPRDGDVGAICESLRRFGQQKPIVVQDSTGFIVAGNHLWKAARALGWDTIAAVRNEMDDETAMAYLVADNRASDLGTYYEEQLAENLKTLAEHGNLRGTGYDGDDVDHILARLSRKKETEVKPEIQFTEELLETHQYVVLYFDNELDWNVAKEALKLDTVKGLAYTRRDGEQTEHTMARGLQRVLRGTDALRALGLVE